MRGPRGLRPAILVGLIAMMILLLTQFIVNSRRSIEVLNYSEFKEKYWDASAGKFKGLASGEITEDELIAEIAEPEATPQRRKKGRGLPRQRPTPLRPPAPLLPLPAKRKRKRRKASSRWGRRRSTCECTSRRVF